jgi:AraC-like DNA-binding protein
MDREKKNRYIQELQRVDAIDPLNALAATICAEFTTAEPEETGSDVVDKACEYILENLSRPDLSVPDVGNAAGVSVQHLLRLFRRRYNMTVVEYINSARIEKAKQLIVTTDMTVSKVVEAVGYSNNVTFSRNFRRYVGMPPSDFRDLNK